MCIIFRKINSVCGGIRCAGITVHMKETINACKNFSSIARKRISLRRLK